MGLHQTEDITPVCGYYLSAAEEDSRSCDLNEMENEINFASYYPSDTSLCLKKD